MRIITPTLALAVSAYALVARQSVANTLTISTNGSVASSPLLYGYMYEDINHSGDGGLYAELLQNRAFQGQTPGTSGALYAWHTVGSASIAVVSNTAPVSSALPNSLSLTIGANVSGSAGFSNEGYWGIGITEGVTYNASFYAKLPANSAFTTQDHVTVQLLSASGEVLASEAVQGLSESWQQFSVRLTAKKTPESAANRFAVVVDGANKSGQTIYFTLLSLFPPTWNDRPNGLRKDIVQTLADAKPSFFRFPGGNNLEGEVVRDFWNWTNTIGPLTNRPGRFGDWTYWNTDGLGLMEYLLLCEDLGMELILGVYAGYSILGETVPANQLQPYIDLAISQIEFVMGDAETNEWAALRAKYGHPEPFKLEYVEIGNEDLYRTAPQSYLAYRWAAFVNAISAKYPQLKLISTTNYGAALNPTPKYVDIHHYERPSYFINRYNMYDDRTLYPSTVQIFEGEYAVIRNNTSSARLEYPTLEAAVAEATFMAGMEKNSDLVFAAAYAPVLQHVNGTQWAPDLIAYDAYNIIKSPSYWVQHMFSVNRGDTILSVQSTAKVNPIYWVASKTKSSAYVKLTNILNTTTTLGFNFPDLNIASDASATVLTHSNYYAVNTPANPNVVVPKEVSFTAGKSFTFDVPGQSVMVLKLSLE
ncbi:alpha-L-arabinofuranosidase A [Rhizoctonia solani 123E]|uniref:non-reducing end alpha-L-arabinofuranosidase n=1 Tax=Rhizoctonia solani 123E TaxID=1423351 RepID=A0A074S2H2_9AGAM|nr:alpha-L-arabinofuranosidase A [Rhizoctonia solani 123E]